MSLNPPRWTSLNPSRYEWERRGLDFIRNGLADHEPNRAWANFEFQAQDGSIYEVDLLVLTPQGLWLVELKSRPGKVEGDVRTWKWTTPEGRQITLDNPIALVNRKAKALASLLKSQPAAKKKPIAFPWVEPLIFLSDPTLECRLEGAARTRICLPDPTESEAGGPRNGILAVLNSGRVQGIERAPKTTIDAAVARALSKALEQAGVRPSESARRVGDYDLGELLSEGPDYQDRFARHRSLPGVHCRVRQYHPERSASEERRKSIERAARREFLILQGLHHSGIPVARDFKEHEGGPVLFFACDQKAVRLDHYLASHYHRMSIDDKLDFLRQIADAVRYAHEKGVINRALSPESILVQQSDGSKPALQVFNWQVSQREDGTPSAATTHMEKLVEGTSLVFAAPEALLDSRAVTPASDVFSLGALAYLIFTGRPPAPSLEARQEILLREKGFRVSGVLDGAGAALEELVRSSTNPLVVERTQSVDEFLILLDLVEEEVTRPDPSPRADPADAMKGAKLEHGYEVLRVLGKGSTAVALLVKDAHGEVVVLKVALSEAQNSSLIEEARALEKLQSEFIVGFDQRLTISGRQALVLKNAGDKTLAAYLREEGRLSLDLLERFGEDLLSAVASLERHGIFHRDIKPSNIGVRSIRKQRLQLVLFDFSLSRAPLENIRLGTPGYLDPFLSLRKPPRWDLAAERYSAAVTIYEMATGVQPHWGDGRSDPALTEDVLSIDAEQFDPQAAKGLADFFQKAMARRPEDRFDDAESMLEAFKEVFRQVEKGGSEETESTAIDLEIARLTDPVTVLGLSTRARNALDRKNVITAGDLLEFPIAEIHLMKGVGQKTRKDILEAIRKLRVRFPEAAAAPSRPVEAKAAIEPETPAVKDGKNGIAHLSLEDLAERIIGKAGDSKKKTSEDRAIRILLGLDPRSEDPPVPWLSQSEAGRRAGVDAPKMSRILSAARESWSRSHTATELRAEITESLNRVGGVMAPHELAEGFLAAHPSSGGSPEASLRLAVALLRAAIETEEVQAEPRFTVRRGRAEDSPVLIARSRDLGAYAARLGEEADRMAREEPLLPPLAVLKRLQSLPMPQLPEGCLPPTTERLVRLAAGASREAAATPKFEIYPRGMTSERALRLGGGALSSLGVAEKDEFTAEEVRDRILNRYPEAVPLPGHPQLDPLLKELGIDCEWDAGKGVYRRKHQEPGQTIRTSSSPRFPTVTPSRRPGPTPEAVTAQTFEDRLHGSRERGGFMVLGVSAERMVQCEAEILRRLEPERISLDALYLKHLRAVAEEHGIEWSFILEVDGAPDESRDRRNLLHLAAQAAGRIAAEVLARSHPVLLVNPGLLARYDQIEVLERLRDGAGRPGACPCLWVLVPMDEQNELPVLDGKEIPIISPGEFTRVPDEWIKNEHRGSVEARK